MTSGTYERDRMRSVHLSIITVLTLSLFAFLPSAIIYEWRENWMLPLFAAALVAGWVLHIRRLFPENSRLWFFAVLAWSMAVFEGMHPTSLFDFSVVAILEFAMFCQADEKRILHISLACYLFVCVYQFPLFASGANGEVSNLTIRQLALHFSAALIIYFVGLGIINKREQDRQQADRVITELTGTRRRAENFMANVSHELRTPVNVVTGLAGVMEERLQSEHDRQDAAHIYEAGRRLSDHVDDILDYTEIETGRITISEEAYTIASVVNDVLESLGVSCREDLPQVVVDVDAAVPQVLLGDARRVKKVLYHLADNAIKFTEHGGVYINVYRMPEPYGINLCFDVRDTGIGMTRDALERVREGIYQEDAERNREHGGFGLGLRIVYGLVHAMEGFVRIESTVGAGTRVHVSIPQLVQQEGRCMEITDPYSLKIALFQRADKFDNPAVLQFYFQMIRHIINEFNLVLQRTTSLEDCKRMLEKEPFTHLFVPDEEYSEDPAYFDRLCETMHVVLVAKAGFHPSPFSQVTVLKKPLYAFPLVKVLNAKSPEEAKRALGTEEPVRFDGIKALVVDDEEMNLVVARGIFTDYGMEVDTALSGMEAIEKVRGKDYAIIFMDHMMPVMDGVEAAHRIRDVLQTSGRRSAIVALTANAVSGAREMFMQEGFDGFVPKPIEKTELERVMKKCL